MKPEDKAAFLAEWEKQDREREISFLHPDRIGELMWQAAIEYARQQPPKPVRLTSTNIRDLRAIYGIPSTANVASFIGAIMDAMGAKDAGPLVDALRESAEVLDALPALVETNMEVIAQIVDTREIAQAALAKWEGK